MGNTSSPSNGKKVEDGGFILDISPNGGAHTLSVPSTREDGEYHSVDFDEVEVNGDKFVLIKDGEELFNFEKDQVPSDIRSGFSSIAG